MVHIEITREFGYVIVTGIASIFLTTYLGVKAGMARRKAGVPYPFMYATAEEAKNDHKKMIFNCHQRAHLVKYIGILSSIFIHELLVMGGLKYPILSSIGGVIYILGRLAFAWGYQTGDPSKRLRGAFGYIGIFILIGTSIASAISLLT
ncbi:hypothetical protein Glove_402g91 [Diversispora epigaea]|uniref:Glutathione S-transferase 3, mitochondrial n=1 Tax=Diversispora epigaea TaxID=1348612 RepID=A0A397H3Q1_9GLOM|nr:hypothetical protein Glove_402g91 [Diversispora epigaea]